MTVYEVVSLSRMMDEEWSGLREFLRTYNMEHDFTLVTTHAKKEWGNAHSYVAISFPRETDAVIFKMHFAERLAAVD
jgi:hypothetical protein